MAELPAYIEEQIRTAVSEHNLILLDLVKRGQTNSTVLEVIVDSETEVNLDLLAELSREIGLFLDASEDTIKGRYRLEVSTPGLDRPLEFDWQFQKNLGRLVKVTWLDKDAKKDTSLFRLLDSNTESLRLEPVKRSKGKAKGAKKDTAQEPVLLPLEKIERIIVEPEL